MDEMVIETAATQVAQARRQRTVLAGLPGIAPGDIASGYQVLQKANAMLVPDLGRVVAYKIGATSPYMRDYLGVSEPVFGEVFASTVQFVNGQVPFSRFRRLGIETEIAVVLGADLTATEARHDRASVAGAIESIHACVELVDDRYADFRTVGPATLAADNFFGAGCVVGRSRGPGSIERLDRLGARTILDGQEVASGTSDALLGHPLDALAWFANCRARLGLPVPAGTLVTLGSITPVFWLDRPLTARIEIEALGAVDVHVEAG
ncbi:2-keto-4-pentenoate hydratase [Geminicoccus roseus]|uniref:2-keto-4-pentenoate hydratase n=1 Tax=Geminicoccus roseus TaxID=404900 RepID=UPI0003FD2C1F|nr:fumarylacetoacetate hydrolase family protein [Geminicoccus roseus]